MFISLLYVWLVCIGAVVRVWTRVYIQIERQMGFICDICVALQVLKVFFFLSRAWRLFQAAE